MQTPRPRDPHRAAGATPRRIAAVPTVVPVLQALKVRQHVGIGPALRAACRPVIEVPGVPAHIDHAIDRRRAAQHLSAWNGQPPAAEGWLRIGAQPPVIALHVHRIGECPRHLDQGAATAAAALNQDDAAAPVLGQTMGQRTARRTGTDDDEVSFHGENSMRGSVSLLLVDQCLVGEAGKRLAQAVGSSGIDLGEEQSNELLFGVHEKVGVAPPSPFVLAQRARLP